MDFLLDRAALAHQARVPGCFCKRAERAALAFLARAPCCLQADGAALAFQGRGCLWARADQVALAFQTRVAHGNYLCLRADGTALAFQARQVAYSKARAGGSFGQAERAPPVDEPSLQALLLPRHAEEGYPGPA